MCRIDVIVAIVLMPCYIASTAEISPSSTVAEQTTINPFNEFYDPQNSEEFFDPMKQTIQSYQDFFTMVPIAQPSSQPPSTPSVSTATLTAAQTIAVQKLTDGDVEVTTQPENQSTMLYEATDESLGLSSNDIVVPFDLTAQQQPLVKEASNEHSQPAQYDAVYSLFHTHPIFNHNDTVQDHVLNVTDGDFNDSETTVSTEVRSSTTTSVPVAASVAATTVSYTSTTTTSSPAPVTQVITNTTLLQTTAAPVTVASTIATTFAPPPSSGYASKKSPKKIESIAHTFQYKADVILRKCLEDTYIRSPVAALINTAPEALRKAKILWTTALRPNTPIDMVLIAFSSSGKLKFIQIRNWCQETRRDLTPHPPSMSFSQFKCRSTHIFMSQNFNNLTSILTIVLFLLLFFMLYCCFCSNYSNNRTITLVRHRIEHTSIMRPLLNEK